MITPQELQEILSGLGFKQVVWNDVTELGVKVQRERLAAASSVEPAALGQWIIMGSDMSTTTKNSLRNAEEGRMVVITSVFERL